MPRLLRHMAVLLTLFLGGWMHYAQAEVYSGDCSAYISWTLDTETGRLTIHGDPSTNTSTPDFRTQNAPWYEYREYIRSAYLGADGWMRMGYHLLKDLPNLTSLILSDSCKGSNQPIIVNCPNLSSIVVKDGNPVYDSRDNCNAVVNHENPTNIYILVGCKGTIIPPSVKKINNYAFMGAGMRAITIPSSIITFSGSYGQEAFADCPNLEEFHVSWTTASDIPSWPSNFTNKTPQSAIKLYVPCGKTDIYAAKNGWKDYTIIEERAGGTCGAIGNENELSWSLSCDASTLTISGSGAMRDWSAETDVPWYNWRESITSVKLPLGLTHIGAYAFYGCAITKIDLPTTVRSFGKKAFFGSSLREICIPEGVTTLPDSLFGGHIATTAPLERLYLPSTLTSMYDIGLGYTRLKTLFIPKSIADSYIVIHWNYNYAPKTIYASWTENVPQRGGRTEAVNTNVSKIHVPYGTTSQYSGYTNSAWSRVCGIVEDVDERAIDLGLSVRWASCNVGATAPEENGTHFMWGDTIARSKYKLSAYPYCGTELKTLTKYNTRSSWGPVVDNRTTLIAFDDAAYINWGETWRMPTEAEWQELLDNCTLEKTTLNGVDVIKVTGPNGNFIYLPSVGYKMDTHNGTGYCYWSSSLNTGELDDGCTKAIYLNGTSGLKKAYRYIGMGVRAVYRREWPSFTLTITDSINGTPYTKAVNAAGTYTLTAKGDDCHQFARWSDGNTDNPRTVTVTADASYTAEFEEITYSGTCGASLTWSLSLCDSTLTISGTGKMTDWSSAENVPWYDYREAIKTIILPDGLESIGKAAFRECTSLDSIVIPNSVTILRTSAFFRCSGLKYVALSESLTTIEGSAFRDCSSLDSLTIPNSVQRIESDAFHSCTSLKYVKLQSSTVSLGGSAFNTCTNLDTVIISGVVTTIYYYAFSGCGKLRSISFPDGLETIGSMAFTECAGLRSITLPNSVASIGESAFEKCSSLDSITLPENLTTIASATFKNCSGLKYVALPAGLTTIRNNAFDHCSALDSIDIPSSVTEIGSYAFLSCKKLANVYVHWTEAAQIPTCPDDIHMYNASDVTLHIPCGTTTSYGNKSWATKFTLVEDQPNILSGTFGAEGDNLTWALSLCDSVMTISGTGKMEDWTSTSDVPWLQQSKKIKHLIIHEGVTNIGSYAFNCQNLKSVEFPIGIDSVGASAFASCSNLESVTFRNGLLKIGASAFYSCTKLQSVTLPDGLTAILSYAFVRTIFTKFDIPGSVTVLGTNALGSNTQVADVYVHWVEENQILTYPNLINTPGTRRLHIPCGTTAFYTNKNWATKFTLIEDQPAIISGTCGAEGHESDVTWELNLCDSTLTISGSGAMADWSLQGAVWYAYRDAIKTVVIEDGVTTIGSSAFYQCGAMQSVTIPNSVTSIGIVAFYECAGLVSVVLPDNLTLIPDGLFEDCSGLESVNIPAGVTAIDNFAFYNCHNLDNIEIPDKVTTIGFRAFENCTNLSSITIPNSVTSIDQWAFKKCTGLQSLEIKGETSIDKEAFIQCRNLETFIISGVVTIVGEKAFYECEKLKSLPFRDGLTDIGDGAFYNCSNLESVDLPSTLDAIGKAAFSGCTALTSITIPSNVETIEDNTFYVCSSLSTIAFAEGSRLKTIGDYAFAMCADDSIAVPDSVTSIGKYAFAACTNLKAINLPAQLATIGEGLMMASDKLSDVYAVWTEESQILTCPNDIHPRNASDVTLYIPCGTTSIYEAKNWATKFALIEYQLDILSGTCGAEGDNLTWTLDLCDSTLTISGTGAMADWDNLLNFAPWAAHCKAIKTVVLPDDLTNIGSYAFDHCINLQSITIPSKVTTIGESAFGACKKLTSLSFPDGLLSLGRMALMGCSGIQSLTLPEGLKSIKYQALALISIDSIFIPNSVTLLGRQVLGCCAELRAANLPAQLVTMEERPFFSCYKLSDVYAVWTEESQILTCPDDIHSRNASDVTLHIPCGTKDLYEAKGWNNKFTLKESSYTFTVSTDDDSMGSVEIMVVTP